MYCEKLQDDQFPRRDSIPLSHECEAEVAAAVFGNMLYRFTRGHKLIFCVSE
jgi:hypothetical protein